MPESILSGLQPSVNGNDSLGKLAAFLKDVASAWKAATQEQRHKLARCLFEEIWLRDKVVVAIKPREELEPFFRLNYEEFVKQNIELATRMGLQASRQTSPSPPLRPDFARATGIQAGISHLRSVNSFFKRWLASGENATRDGACVG